MSEDIEREYRDYYAKEAAIRAAMTRGTERQHEPTCAYHGLPFKTGSGNRICSCPGRVIPPDEAAS